MSSVHECWKGVRTLLFREALLLFSPILGETRAEPFEVGKVESDISLAANQSRTSRQLQNDVTDVYRLERFTFDIFKDERRGEREERGNSPIFFILAAKTYSHYKAAACSTFVMSMARVWTPGTTNRGDLLRHASLMISSCLQTEDRNSVQLPLSLASRSL